MTENVNTFWTTGYLPNGCKVSFTIAIDPNSAAETALEFTNYLLANGFSQHEPGLNEGEQSFVISAVARRLQAGENGKPDVPIIDMYQDELAFASLKTWLNTDGDINAFERWSGLTLESIPEFSSLAALERGKNTKLDEKYIVRLPRPARVIYTNNPDWTEGSKKPKRKFVRFDGIAAAAPAPTTTNGNGAHSMAWNKDTAAALVNEYGRETVFAALDIREKLGEWRGTLEQARQAIANFLASAPQAEPF